MKPKIQLPNLLLLVIFILMVTCSISYGQLSESFETALVPTDTTPGGWSQQAITGLLYGFPNGFKRAGTGSIMTIGAHPSITAYNGNNVIKFNNRTVIYPTASGAPNGNEAVLISRSLDWSAKISGGSGVISMRFYRDNTLTNGVNNVNDRIEVYINNQPSLSGAQILTDVATSATTIPRSSSLAPVTAAGWQLLTFNTPFGGNLKWDTCSSVYVLIKAISAGGNNMFIDSVSAPEWKTVMVVTHAELFYQNTNIVPAGSNNNVVLGLRIITKGSIGTKKIDRIKFYTTGSTNFLTDVSAARCYFTGKSPVWYPGANQIPASTGSTLADLDFGWSGVSGCVISGQQPWDTLVPGTENYLWLVYDITAGAMSGSFVDADFAFLYAAAICPAQIGCIPSTLPGSVEIGPGYTAPFMVTGTSRSNYNSNDFISAIELVGENSSMIENWNHDAACVPCLSTGTNCNRFACHQPDYTLFPPVNNGAVTNRFVQLSTGKGIRTATPGYYLNVQAGTWFNGNNVNAFIDWNRDGDFSDSYSGSGGVINEWCNSAGNNVSGAYPGTAQQLSSANMGNPWLGIWAIWTINIPDPTDIVINVGGAGGPAKSGHIRMRVREVYANVNFTPFSSETYGETEDYTLSIIGTCAPLASNVNIWYGNTKNWNDLTNWCPSVPTRDDIAYIPALPMGGFFPTIETGTNAICRTLKIENGAQLTIDCTNNGSLTVCDSLIIGKGTITASSSLIVNSEFNNKATIPAASAIPPNGNGFLSCSPFLTASNMKTQISYTAVELNSMGFKSGDIIDTLVFWIKAISPTAGTSTWNNFRIAYWSMTLQKTWGTTLPAGVDTAAYTTTGATLKGYIVGTSTSGISLTLNGTGNGLDTFFIALNPGAMVWDGKDMVLSFEYWMPAAAARNYLLYVEGSATNNLLGLRSTVGSGSFNSIQSGYTFTGYQKSVLGINANINYTVSNYRPRIGFIVHRNYNQFPISIGRAFINNNPGGIPAGAAGFVAGKSTVIFDASLRALPNSPGLTSTNFWNPTSQPAVLIPDTLAIASGNQPVGSPGFITGNSKTTFDELELSTATTGAESILKLAQNTYSNKLKLTSGELRLNKKTFTVLNGDSSAISSTNGYIRSENSDGMMLSNLAWQIGSKTGNHYIPFGKSAINKFAFNYKGIAGDVGTLTVSTYGTTQQNNLPFPVSPTSVTNLNQFGVNVADSVVDRFWRVTRSTNSSLSNQIQFKYSNINDGTASANYEAGRMKAQRYNPAPNNIWQWPYGCTNPSLLCQTDALNGNYVTVTVDDVNAFGVWSVFKKACEAAKAKITAGGPLTFCAGDSVVLTANSGNGLTYQWKKNLNLIAGATNISYTAKTAGAYRCIVTNSNGCTKLSNVLGVTVPCRTENLSGAGIELYPNPANTEFYMASETPFDKNSYIGIYDLTGRKITTDYNFMDEYTAHINTQNLVNGSYMVKTIVAGEVKLLKLIVAR